MAARVPQSRQAREGAGSRRWDRRSPRLGDRGRRRVVVHGTETHNCEIDAETGEYTSILYNDLSVDGQTGVHSTRANTIYMGCVSGAVGKAGMWGYTPHEKGQDWHQTATRMIRADYCGDGVSHTENGTEIQLTDEDTINVFSDAGEETESLWTANGAVCVRSPRLETTDLGELGCTVTECSDTDDLSTHQGTLIWTKNI